MIHLNGIQNSPIETPATPASEAEEGYLVWGAGLLPPVFVRPIVVTRAPKP
jgi:hypothetical protein